MCPQPPWAATHSGAVACRSAPIPSAWVLLLPPSLPPTLPSTLPPTRFFRARQQLPTLPSTLPSTLPPTRFFRARKRHAVSRLQAANAATLAARPRFLRRLAARLAARPRFLRRPPIGRHAATLPRGIFWFLRALVSRLSTRRAETRFCDTHYGTANDTDNDTDNDTAKRSVYRCFKAINDTANDTEYDTEYDTDYDTFSNNK